MAKPVFNVGDRVQLTGKFLQSTGQVAGSEGRKVFTILAIKEYTRGCPPIVTVDALNSPETMKCWTAEEIAADPSLKNRRINSANLKHYGKPSSRDA